MMPPAYADLQRQITLLEAIIEYERAYSAALFDFLSAILDIAEAKSAGSDYLRDEFQSIGDMATVAISPEVVPPFDQFLAHRKSE